MGWFGKFITSSIGKKLIMSLTGLFLIMFLIVHLLGNLQLLHDDEGQAFNLYARFMTTNPLIKVISYSLYTFILLHAILGVVLWRQNRAARGNQAYAMTKVRAVNTNPGFAKNMAWLGIIIFVFLLIHMYQFWFQMHMDKVPYATYDGEEVKNLFEPVRVAFTDVTFVVFYIVCMVIIGFHLWHGFQSAFQTLGINHQKWSPVIRFLGKAYAIIIPALFALIPIAFYIKYA